MSLKNKTFYARQLGDQAYQEPKLVVTFEDAEAAVEAAAHKLSCAACPICRGEIGVVTVSVADRARLERYDKAAHPVPSGGHAALIAEARSENRREVGIAQRLADALEATGAELFGVMHSVDKWFPEGDERLNNNPATRAGDAREIALKALEACQRERVILAQRAEMSESLHRSDHKLADEWEAKNQDYRVALTKAEHKRDIYREGFRAAIKYLGITESRDWVTYFMMPRTDIAAIRAALELEGKEGK